MRLCEINPYIRFAASVCNGIMNTAVKVTDCRIFYVLEGKAQIHIGNECFHLVKNSLFYCPGGSTYRIQAQFDLQLICINFDLDRSHTAQNLPFPVCAHQKQWAQMQVYFSPVEDYPLLNGHILLEDAAWLQNSIGELIEEYRAHTPLSDLLCGSLLKAILLRLHRAKQQKLPPKLAMVQAYIRANYRQELTNSQLGELAGYHAYHLNRLFLSYTGMNLHEYLIKVRMEQAAHLILNTHLPLSAIAEQVGMRSYPHFSGRFKHCYGCSPAQYRSRRV